MPLSNITSKHLSRVQCTHVSYMSYIYSHLSIYRASRGKRKMHGIQRGTVFREVQILTHITPKTSIYDFIPYSYTFSFHLISFVVHIRQPLVNLSDTILCIICCTIIYVIIVQYISRKTATTRANTERACYHVVIADEQY